MSTFVTLGNATQPFSRLLDALAGCDDLLPRPVVVQAGLTDFSHGDWEIVNFLDPVAFERRVREATLVIAHAGAGTLIHAVAAGKRPVVMPRMRRHGEAVDDHQMELAEAMSERGMLALARETGDLRACIGRTTAETSPSTSDRKEPRLVGEIRALLHAVAARKC